MLRAQLEARTAALEAQQSDASELAVVRVALAAQRDACAAAQIDAAEESTRIAVLLHTLRGELSALDDHSAVVEQDLVTLRGLGGGGDGADAPLRRGDYGAVEAWMESALGEDAAKSVWREGEGLTARELLGALRVPETRSLYRSPGSSPSHRGPG